MVQRIPRSCRPDPFRDDSFSTSQPDNTDRIIRSICRGAAKDKPSRPEGKDRTWGGCETWKKTPPFTFVHYVSISGFVYWLFIKFTSTRAHHVRRNAGDRKRRDGKRRAASNWRANGNGIALAMSGNDFPRDSTSLGFAFSFHNTVHLLATGFEVKKKEIMKLRWMLISSLLHFFSAWNSVINSYGSLSVGKKYVYIKTKAQYKGDEVLVKWCLIERKGDREREGKWKREDWHLAIPGSQINNEFNSPSFHAARAEHSVNRV